MNEFSETDLLDLKKARNLIENPTVPTKLAAMIGKPIDMGMDLLPEKVKGKVTGMTQTALLKGLEFSVYTIGNKKSGPSQDRLHKFIITASGAIGGVFGLFTLPVELPFSTCLILRSIADIAQSEGHDISNLDIRLSCLEVFALGGHHINGDSGTDGYWETREELSKAVKGAANHIARNGLIDSSAPPIINLLFSISSRFGTMVSEQVAAQAMPLVGAFGGGLLNYLFIDHFQSMAKSHFIIKRLENTYGSPSVRRVYHELKNVCEADKKERTGRQQGPF